MKINKYLYHYILIIPFYYYGISPKSIDTKPAMVINARKIVWYFMREYFGTNISFEKLGKIYGKSHSNASQMVNSLIGEMQFNNGLRQEIKEIKQLIDDFIVNTNAAIC